MPSQWPRCLTLTVCILCLLWWHSTDLVLFGLVGLLNVLCLATCLIVLRVFSGPATHEALAVQRGPDSASTQETGLQSSCTAPQHREATTNLNHACRAGQEDAGGAARTLAGSRPIISTTQSSNDGDGSYSEDDDAYPCPRTDQCDAAEITTAQGTRSREELKEFYKSHPGRTVMIRVGEPADGDVDEPLADMDVPDRGELSIIVHADRDDLGTVYRCHHPVPKGWSNQDLFRPIEPITRAALEVGENITVMTDGQSGAGKSWTMFEGPSNLVSCVVEQVFTYTEELRGEQREAAVSWTALEFYRDSFYDLLTPQQRSRAAEPCRKCHGRWNFSRRDCSASDELQAGVRQALRNRHLKPTDKNKRSSRGHTVISIRVSAAARGSDPQIQSDVLLVDLAGSERQPKDRYDPEQLEDAKTIATTRQILHSMFLPDCPSANPRDSEFTLSLRGYISPTSRTVLVACVSPLRRELAVSQETLKFADKIFTDSVSRSGQPPV